MIRNVIRRAVFVWQAPNFQFPISNFQSNLNFPMSKLFVIPTEGRPKEAEVEESLDPCGKKSRDSSTSLPWGRSGRNDKQIRFGFWSLVIDWSLEIRNWSL